MNTTTHPPLIVQIPPGDLGALHSLAAMRAAADRLAARPETRALAARIHDEAGRKWSSLDTLFWWIKEHYRFAPDPARAETLHNHAAQLRGLIDYPHAPALGDCDDRAVFTAALCQVIGYRTRFVCVSSDARRPFHHVYAAAVELTQRLCAMDSQVCAAAGIEPPGIVRRYTEGETIRPADLLDENGNPYQEASQ